MLYESGILRTFFQRNTLPLWITHISCMSVLHFTLQSSSRSHNIRGLNMCVVSSKSSTKSLCYPMIKLRNLTKGYMWIYSPRRCCVILEGSEEGIVWLSHWTFGNDEFEVGDELVVQGIDIGGDIMACGASVMYDDGHEKGDPLACYTSWNHITDDHKDRQGETSSSSSSIYHYDVFLSFRGINTRYNFTDHLHKALMDAAINTFLDDAEIPTGEDLKPELETAIKASRASVIVLSKDYASSTWCLDELVLILEQRRTSKHIVIPIFYHVKPTDVRKQQSSFGDAMAKHKQKMEAEPNEKKRSQWAEKIKQWEEALTEVANMKGEEASGGRETILIERIVKEITSRLEIHKRSKIPQLIGMENSVRTVTSFLKDGSSHATEILTIWGMAGIGKTYLANYIFKLHYLDFERSSFLEDIERRSKQPNALLDLQKQLLKDIRDATWMDIHDVDAGTSKIEMLLLRGKTLLVLDGIDDFTQLDVLIGRVGLHPGSKIIITTKDVSLTEMCSLFERKVPPKHMKHKLVGLNQEESRQLLSCHAFKSNDPKENFKNQTRKVVDYCGGHPLALKVLGSSLRLQDVAAWEDTIELLQKETNPTIQKVLQISFDSLPSKNDKELFKHIACFFVGEDREFTEATLKACGLSTTFGFSKLIDRCLLTVEPDKKLMMHQLLQEMGRDLVRQESPEKPWKRSRLWHHEESYNVLKQEKGTTKIQGLVLDMKMIDNDRSHGTSSYTKVKFANDRCNKRTIKTDAFNKMDKLRLLQLHYVQLHGSYEHFPKGLTWLSMHGFPLSYIPSDLQMENMVALDMSYSNIRHLWKKPKMLGSLKFLILRCCHELVSVGHFDGFPLLERLILGGCVSLVEVCESIGCCDRLLVLDVSGCAKLKRLPRGIGKLKNLATLLINGCSSLGEFPMELKDLESLQVLEANDMNIEPRVSSRVTGIPRSLMSFANSLPSSLVELSLKNNNLFDESFPPDFGGLPMLEVLHLDGNPINSLPNCVRSLSRLEVLSLYECRRLKTVLCAPTTLKGLFVNSCDSLEKITFHPEMSAPPIFNYVRPIQTYGKHMADVDEEIVCRLGWINIRQHVKDQKLATMNTDQLLVDEIPRVLVLPIQMYYHEYGIFCTFFHGKRLPDWITHGSSLPFINFTLPSSGRRIRGLNVCIVISTLSNKNFVFPIITLNNSTKPRTWFDLYPYRTPWCVIPKSDEESIVCLTHWMLTCLRFEDGDEGSVRVIVVGGDMKEFGISFVYDDGNEKEEDSLRNYIYGGYGGDDEDDDGNNIIRKCGISLVYDEDDDGKEEGVLGYYKSWDHIIGGYLSPFQTTTPREYYLNTQRFFQSSVAKMNEGGMW
ncbi:hypothetical protein OSB04_013260 [Centaurea solstitialis]|uniref:TIR domain-containing protein n=1 Tax=Centaurea solstitialis TaxID=347529 RepID=A0AA38TQU7_9ASTR|nr:hypothetical protein OSB04_013260 [Centaurea solstitialis]